MAQQERLRAPRPSCACHHRVRYSPQHRLIHTVTLMQLLAAISNIQAQWSAVQFTGTYADAKEHSATFATYKQSTKRAWVTEKQDVTTLFGNVQTKLRTYGLREYVPPAGLAITVGSKTSCMTYFIRVLIYVIRI